MIAIVDYKIGNLGSVANMLKRVGAAATVTSDPDTIRRADKLILPGVGAFENGMANLAELGLLPVLEALVIGERRPLLGICLGMQLLTRRSEEGKAPGLGWIEGETVRFRFEPEQGALKVPHMGWNTVTPVHRDSLFRDLDDEHRFYFAHSYHVVCERSEDVLATTRHGYNFVASLERGNIMGIQFHPEKSHRYGLQLLKNFAERA
jgi:imidazole glycerol-phosphate synthase subunit HisH